jgi:hypothetical protein
LLRVNLILGYPHKTARSLFLLFVIGSYDSNEIPKFKRTQTFVPEDYFTLIRIVDLYDKILTTPNILTEVSNLTGQIKEYQISDCFNIFSKSIELLDEYYFTSIDVSKRNEFINYGLTDTSIIHLMNENECMVLTDDFKLYNYLSSQGLDAINFNHVRTINW